MRIACTLTALLLSVCFPWEGIGAAKPQAEVVGRKAAPRVVAAEEPLPFPELPSLERFAPRKTEGRRPSARLALGPIDGDETRGDVPAALWEGPDGGVGHYLVRFRSAEALRDGRATLRASGVEVLEYLPDRTLLVQMPARRASGIRETDGVAAVSYYRPVYKLSAALERLRVGGEGRARFAISLFPGQPATTVETALRTWKLLSDGRVANGRRTTVYVSLLPRQLPRLIDLARLEAVRSIEPLPPARTMNSNTDQVLQVGAVGGGNPFWAAGVRGTGQTVAVMDTGLDVDTIWFGDTATDAGVPGAGHRKVLSYEPWGGGTVGTCSCVNIGPGPDQPLSFSHGTLVTANILADRTDFGLSDIVEGMAPGAKVHFQDIGNDPSSTGTCDFGVVFPPDDLTLPLEDAWSRGARVHNNSWARTLVDTYTPAAGDIDAFLWTHPESAVVFAAGDCSTEYGVCSSANGSSIGAPATAKNDITVGASDQDPNQLDTAGFSGRGPETTGSGRVGPTVMMVGTDTAGLHAFASVNGGQDLGPSCAFASGDCDTTGAIGASCIVFGADGTSYAASFTSGALLLMRDYLAQGLAPDGVAHSERAITDPSGPLLKALLINSTTWMSGSGTGGARFNNDQGYGRVVLTNTLPLAGNPQTPSGLLLWDVARQLGLDAVTPSRKHPFEVVDTNREVRITLAWYDAPSAAGTDGSLINDLSLEVTDPQGNLYRGNDFSGAFSVVNGVDEDVQNPTEMVVIAPQQLVAGTYTATVKVGAAGVNVSHPEFGGQPYALVASGGITAACTTEICDGIDNDCDGQIDENAPIWYADGDGDGIGTAEVSQMACQQPLGFVALGGDCDDGDADVWATPGPATGLRYEDPSVLSWEAPAEPGATQLTYDVLRSSTASDFVVEGVCLDGVDASATTRSDPSVPLPGEAFFYLVRAHDTCPSGSGSVGTDSAGVDRPARSCP